MSDQPTAQQASASAAPLAAGVDVSGRLGVRSGTKVTLSIDAMGGDRGPAAIVAGISRSAAKNSDVDFIVHGDEAELTKLINKRKNLKGRVEIRGTQGVVTMSEKPSQAMRRTDTSMRSAIDAVRDGEAQANLHHA